MRPQSAKKPSVKSIAGTSVSGSDFGGIIDLTKHRPTLKHREKEILYDNNLSLKMTHNAMREETKKLKVQNTKLEQESVQKDKLIAELISM